MTDDYGDPFNAPVHITWTPTPDYNAQKAGQYVFKAQFPEDYVLGKNAAVSAITVCEAGSKSVSCNPDTTVDLTNKTTGQTYWFKITPDDKNAKVGYSAGNGKALSTMSKGKQKDGSYLFGFKITGKSGDKSGVYVNVDGKDYCVFHVVVK